MKIYLTISAICISLISFSQPDRWQQHVNYKMDVTVDAENNALKGKQKLEYTNNSPDTLHVIYYHLYWNAFQPGSMMDERSQHLGKKSVTGKIGRAHV